MTHPAENPRFLRDLTAHDAYIARLAAVLVADPGHAADVAQEARFAAWRNPPKDGDRVRGFFAVLVARFASNRRRSEVRRTRNERRAARAEATAADRVLEREEARRKLLAAVEALDEPSRTVILLRWFDGRTPSDIAAGLGLPVETIKTRLKRAHARLRDGLAREFGDRDVWISALLPLARFEGASAATAGGGAAIGGILVAMKTKVLIGGLLLLAAAAVAWVLTQRGTERGDGQGAASPTAASSSARPDAHATTAAGDAAAAAIVRMPFADEDSGRAVFVLLHESRGAPVAGADVVLQRLAGKTEKATSDEHGIVRFAPDSARGALAVRLPRRPIWTTFVALGPARTELVIAAGRTFYGRVTIDGKPPQRPVELSYSGGWKAAGSARRFPEAEALFPMVAGRHVEMVGLTTDATGRFSIEGLDHEQDLHANVKPVDPRLEVDSVTQRRSRCVEYAALTLGDTECLVPLRRLATAVGRIRSHEGGPPPAGLRLTVLETVDTGGASLTTSSARIGATPTDAEGRFSFPISQGFLGAGLFALELEVLVSPGSTSVKFKHRDVGLAARDFGDLLLPPMRTVRCEVRDVEGRPVPGARVCDNESPDGEHAATTDRHGTTSLSLGADARFLRIEAPGFNRTFIEVRAGAADPVAVTLRRGSRLVVRVLTADGRPAASAPLSLRYAWVPIPGDRLWSNQGIVRGWGNVRIRDHRVDRSGVVAAVRTDEGGVFEIVGLRAGDAAVVVLETGSDSIERTAMIKEDEQAVVEFRYAEIGHEYAVRILGPEGQLLDGYAKASAAPGGEGVELKLDVDDAFRAREISLPKAWITIRSTEEYLPECFEARPSDGREPDVVRLKRGRTLTFQVVDETGAPLPDVWTTINNAWLTASADSRPGVRVIKGVGGEAPVVRIHRMHGSIDRTLVLTEELQKIVIPSTGTCMVTLDASPPFPTELSASLVLEGEAEEFRLPLELNPNQDRSPTALFRDVRIGRYAATLTRFVEGRREPVGAAVRFEVRRGETTSIVLRP